MHCQRLRSNTTQPIKMNDCTLHCQRLRPHTTTLPIKMNDGTLHCQRLRPHTTTQPIKMNDRTLHWREWFVVLGRKTPLHQHSRCWTSLQHLSYHNGMSGLCSELKWLQCNSLLVHHQQWGSKDTEIKVPPVQKLSKVLHSRSEYGHIYIIIYMDVCMFHPLLGISSFLVYFYLPSPPSLIFFWILSTFFLAFGS